MTYKGLSRVIVTLLREFSGSEIDFVLTWHDKDKEVSHTMTNLPPGTADQVQNIMKNIQEGFINKAKENA